MKKEVTMTDIAAKVGVSVVTVSKALSGKSGVGKQLREEILSEAERQGYIPAESKRAEKKQIVVGVIVAERFISEKQSFYWKMYQELSQEAMRHEGFSLFEVVSGEEELACEVPKILRFKKADVLVVLGVFHRSYLTMLNEQSEIPLFSLDSVYEEVDGDAIIVDNSMGGYLMTNYLLERGHEKIGFVGTLHMTPSIDDRYLGYYKAMVLAKKTVEQSWIVDDRSTETGKVGAEGTLCLPDPENMPSAFFCNCDFTARLMIGKLEEAGYRVPEDISVVSFDHYLPEENPEVSLTTYEVNMKAIVRQMMTLIKTRLEETDWPFCTILARGRLIEGNTVREITR